MESRPSHGGESASKTASAVSRANRQNVESTGSQAQQGSSFPRVSDRGRDRAVDECCAQGPLGTSGRHVQWVDAGDAAFEPRLGEFSPKRILSLLRLLGFFCSVGKFFPASDEAVTFVTVAALVSLDWWGSSVTFVTAPNASAIIACTAFWPSMSTRPVHSASACRASIASCRLSSAPS